MQQSDYVVMTPKTPIYRPYNHTSWPDVIDISLIKIPKSVKITNINDLSSDHKLIFLEIHSTPIASFPPSANRFINWCKYADLLAKHMADIIICTTVLSNIDRTIDNFTTSIHTAIQQNSSALKPRRAAMDLPPYII